MAIAAQGCGANGDRAPETSSADSSTGASSGGASDGAAFFTDATEPPPDAARPSAPDGSSPDGATIDGAGGSGIPPSCPLGGVGAVMTKVGAGGGGAAQTITLDGAGTGRVFDGMGAISGGGGNSRLLYEYPEPQRGDVLDYLFRPGYGAAMHILKVEIGGDTQSTDGAEPSHMHTANDLDCNRGYEWWLMKEAKARNPAIKLYALSWGAPGWFAGKNFWSDDDINYHIQWLKCAQSHDLTIDYMGGWNERGYNKSWYETFHSAIASNGYKTKVVCADSDWSVGRDAASDPAFKAACDVIGPHYPCGGDGAPATSCPTDPSSEGLGIPLWASENGSQDFNSGAQAMARAMNRGYIDAQMTSFINWPLIASILPKLSWETDGVAVANQPWSGWYSMGKQLWVMAHTTQFTQPGWRYIDKASGYIGGNRSNGSYVTIRSQGGDYSVILETADAKTEQTVAFKATGGLSTADPHVWATDLGSKSATDFFVHAADPAGTGGTFWVTLQPNFVYTISTTTGQCKSAAMSPPSNPALSLPYSDNFDSYPKGSLAHLISDMEVSFETAPCGGGRNGMCYRQMAPVVPIAWASPGTAFTIVGTADWGDYTVTADVLLESSGAVELMGRFNGLNYQSDAAVLAYYFSVSHSGAWSIYSNNGNASHKTLASGRIAGLGTNTWHTLAFRMKGSALTAIVDGTSVGTANDSTYPKGGAGLSVGSASHSWLNAQFDNLKITSP